MKVDDSLVSCDVRVTFAPATTAPFGSWTTPSTEALLLWAMRYGAVPRTTTATRRIAILPTLPVIYFDSCFAQCRAVSTQSVAPCTVLLSCVTPVCEGRS